MEMRGIEPLAPWMISLAHTIHPQIENHLFVRGLIPSLKFHTKNVIRAYLELRINVFNKEKL